MINCPHCGQPMVASTPAQDAFGVTAAVEAAKRAFAAFAPAVRDAFANTPMHGPTTDAPPPSGWRDRDKLT